MSSIATIMMVSSPITVVIVVIASDGVSDEAGGRHPGDCERRVDRLLRVTISIIGRCT